RNVAMMCNYCHLSSFVYSRLCLCKLHSFPTRRSSDLNVGTPRRYSLGRLDHSAIPEIPLRSLRGGVAWDEEVEPNGLAAHCVSSDRKSTRLNSSHVKISYAVFCLKKKK